VKEDSIHSPGPAAALSFTWRRLTLMKGTSDSSCSAEASVASQRFNPIAVPVWCCLGLPGSYFFGFFSFFSSRIILASGFLIFTEFAKKELPGAQRKARMCIGCSHLNAAGF